MELKLIVAENCPACVRAETSIRKIACNYANVFMSVVDASEFTGMPISIVPALLIDDVLFSYGDVDEEKVSAIAASR